MTDNYFQHTFATSGSPDSGKVLSLCLKRQNAHAGYQEYKRKTFEYLHLEPGMRVIDIGCGLGDDAAAIARTVSPKGEVVGIDVSRDMIAAAKMSYESAGIPLVFVVDDATSLHFEDNRFDAARIDRVLQHVASADRAIAQAARVIRPGGMLLCIEPDWETFTIAHSRRDVTRKLLNAWCDQYRNPWAGRHLYECFRELEFGDILVSGEVLIYYSLEFLREVYQLDKLVDDTVRSGAVTTEDGNAWMAEMEERSQKNTVFSSVTLHIVCGSKKRAT